MRRGVKDRVGEQVLMFYEKPAVKSKPCIQASHANKKIGVPETRYKPRSAERKRTTSIPGNDKFQNAATIGPRYS